MNQSYEVVGFVEPQIGCEGLYKERDNEKGEIARELTFEEIVNVLSGLNS